jgi:hypothetical protein
VGLTEDVLADRPVNAYATCSVVVIAAQLPDPESRADWMRAADNRNVPAGRLAVKLLEKYHLEIGESPIQRHRRGHCKCSRDTSELSNGDERGDRGRAAG